MTAQWHLGAGAPGCRLRPWYSATRLRIRERFTYTSEKLASRLQALAGAAWRCTNPHGQSASSRKRRSPVTSLRCTRRRHGSVAFIRAVAAVGPCRWACEAASKLHKHDRFAVATMAAMKELRQPQSYPESRLPPGVQPLRRPPARPRRGARIPALGEARCADRTLLARLRHAHRAVDAAAAGRARHRRRALHRDRRARAGEPLPRTRVPHVGRHGSGATCASSAALAGSRAHARRRTRRRGRWIRPAERVAGAGPAARRAACRLREP